MTAKAVIEQMDELLAPIGFSRKDALWNRRNHSIIEVIDVQISKAGDAVTINAGALDTGVYQELWGKAPPLFIDEPFCVVRARIGEIMGNHDLWWSLGDDDTPTNLVQAVSAYVLPFLVELRTQAALEASLEKFALEQREPLPKVYLAILKHRRGDIEGACAILRHVSEKTLGEWRNRAVELAERIGCSWNDSKGKGSRFIADDP